MFFVYIVVQFGQITVVGCRLGVGSIGRAPTILVGLVEACSMHQGSSKQEDEGDEGSKEGCDRGWREVVEEG